MKKVLIIDTVPMTMNGMTSVILQTVKQCSGYVSFEVLTNKTIDPLIKEEISRYSKKIFVLNDRKKHMLKYRSELKALLKNNSYDYVHIHGNSSTMVLETFLSRKVANVKVIVHSHNTKCKHKILNSLLSKSFNKSYDTALACSKEAGEWLYDGPFMVIPNSIETNKYKFSNTIRDNIRNKLGLATNSYVIGHVGLFNKQKNHKKLFGVFNELSKRNNAVLLCVTGDDSIPGAIKKQLHKLHIEERVIILKSRDDINNLMQAMDCFIFPSLHEGLGIVLLEAQASGLPIYASDTIPKAVNITNSISFISLNKTDLDWANIIQLDPVQQQRRLVLNEIVAKSKYDAHYLKAIYKEIYK